MRRSRAARSTSPTFGPLPHSPQIRHAAANDRRLYDLFDLSSLLLESSAAAATYFPDVISRVLRFVFDKTLHVFPDSMTAWTVLGGFVFLRFICPALIQPELWALTPPLSSSFDPQLLSTVSSFIQRLANLTYTDELTPVKTLSNLFVDTKRVEYFHFLRQLAVCFPAAVFRASCRTHATRTPVRCSRAERRAPEGDEHRRAPGELV